MPNPRQPLPSPAAGSVPPPDAARDAAYRSLADAAARLPDLDHHPIQDQALGPRDAAFAHAVVHAGLQRWLTLSYILGGFLSRPFAELEPQLRGVLVGGAAQLLLLDKVPVHAAINESVEWAKLAIRPGASAMVNAVLRKVAGLLVPVAAADTRPAWTGRRDELLLPDGSARRLNSPVLPDNPAERLAVATSHPLALVQTWLNRFGPVAGRDLVVHSLAPAPTIVYTAADRAPWPASFTPHASRNHHVYTGGREDLRRLLQERPQLWVQDAASSEAITAIAELRPRLIVDLCAGQGTKTRQLASTFPDARILASDTDEARFATLRRLFSTHPRVKAVEPGRLLPGAVHADLILLDVPCSNTGVLARRIEAKYRWADRQLSRLVQLQRDIIEKAATLLAPAGQVLYSTCSLEPAENDDQVRWASDRFRLAATRSNLTLPRGLPGDSPTQYRDGSFYALLGRPG